MNALGWQEKGLIASALACLQMHRIVNSLMWFAACFRATWGPTFPVFLVIQWPGNVGVSSAWDSSAEAFNSCRASHCGEVCQSVLREDLIPAECVNYLFMLITKHFHQVDLPNNQETVGAPCAFLVFLMINQCRIMKHWAWNPPCCAAQSFRASPAVTWNTKAQVSVLFDKFSVLSRAGNCHTNCYCVNAHGDIENDTRC